MPAATQLAQERLGNVLFHMIMLAALPRLAGMDVATMKQAMVEIIPRFHDQNRVALDVGYQSPAVPATV